MDLKPVSEELAFIRSELKRLDEAFIEAAENQYYEKASEFRFEKHKNKLRLHELKYKCLVYYDESLKFYYSINEHYKKFLEAEAYWDGIRFDMPSVYFHKVEINH